MADERHTSMDPYMDAAPGTPVGGLAPGTPVGSLGTPVGGLGTPVGGLAPGTPVGGLGTPPRVGPGTPRGGPGTPRGGPGTPRAGLGTPPGGLGTPRLEPRSPSGDAGAEESEAKRRRVEDRLVAREHEIRVILAAGLRMLDKQGQSDMCAGFFAARHPCNRSWFYAARHGIFFEEAQPSDFFLYDDRGQLVQGEQVVHIEAGDDEKVSRKACYRQAPDARPNAPVIPLCLAVFGSCPHINAMIHAHGPNAMALASCEDNEVKPMSEHGFMFYERTKYISCNFFFDPEYIREVKAALSDGQTFCLQARNHSYFMVAGDPRTCYLRSYMFEEACKVQLKVMAVSKCFVPSRQECERHRSSYEGYVEEATGNRCPAYDGSLEFPGILRKLDREEPGWRDLPDDPDEHGYAFEGFAV